MENFSINFSRKRSVSQYNFTETSFGVSVPLSIFGDVGIAGEISSAIKALEGDPKATKQLEDKTKKKKKSKKDDEDVHISPSALGCLLTSIALAAVTGGSAK